jgi:hypothetical protein
VKGRNMKDAQESIRKEVNKIVAYYGTFLEEMR